MGAVEDLIYVGEQLAQNARATIDDAGQSVIGRVASAGQRVVAAKAAFEAAQLAAGPRVEPDELQQTLDALADELESAGLLGPSAQYELEDFMRLVLSRIHTAEKDEELKRIAAAAEVGMRTLGSLEADFRASADRSGQAKRVADRCTSALTEIRGLLRGSGDGQQEDDRAAA